MARRTPIRAPARVVFRQGREHLRFDPPNLLLTTLFVGAAIAVTAIAERSTNFTDYNAPKQPVVFQPPNTLLTLLQPPVAAPVVQTPFVQEDWPNPRGSPVRDLTWTQTPEVIPQVPDVAVANRIPNQTDWPNPLRSPARDLTWTQSPKVQQTVSVAEVGPRAHGILDYFSREQPPLFDPPNTLALLTRPVVVAVVASPFDQADWPNPQRPWVRDLTWSQSPKVQQNVLAPAVAEGQRSHGFTDYFAKRPPAQFDPPNLLLLQPVIPPPPAGTAKPFLQKDWPNPILRAVRLKTTPQSFRPGFDVVDTTDVASTTFPFSQADWPNPVLRKPFRESGWIKFANIGDIPARPTPVVSTPFSQNNWPNPVLRKVRIKTPESFRPGFDVAVETTTATTFPFSQADWPNPVRRISPKEWGFTRFANVGDVPKRFIAPNPFDQTDWPNPLIPWRRDLTWLQSPKVQQIVPEPAGTEKPFLQADWPNPVLRTPFKESGWARFANIGDIPAAAPPIPVPPVPTDEVKPSGGRVHGSIDPEFRYAIEGRKTYVQKLRDWRIAQEAAEVIEQVALQQAATLEVDEIRNARELKKALRLAKVEDDARYLELLAERRELAKNEEIGALLYKAIRDEEDVLALLMIASQLL